ncbi:hypothetical protein K503DRAFT_80977 [Rhizopogon vinicolor AM-OR11-026]|uniref:Uncharacterized protein n=1 Tax=Rhizopogon vinicolor AM-OR11-026 TaxID=1314800 RepID=A0A1B7N3V9_9AGAM|nr:hypothetical protein K503DRAFT_80977 [Rhizopogon vinicolor AM-OR11-026]
MNASQTPLIDEENPLYCPNFPAAAYLADLRQSLKSNAFIFQDLSLRSFFWKLGLCSAKEDQEFTRYDVGHDTLNGSLWPSSPDAESPIIPARNQVSDDLPDVPVLRCGLAGLAWRRSSLCIRKHFRDSSESEDHDFLGGPPKRGRSSQSVHTSPVHINGIEPLSYTLRSTDETSYQGVPNSLEGVSRALFRKLLHSPQPLLIAKICKY